MLVLNPVKTVELVESSQEFLDVMQETRPVLVSIVGASELPDIRIEEWKLNYQAERDDNTEVHVFRATSDMVEYEGTQDRIQNTRIVGLDILQARAKTEDIILRAIKTKEQKTKTPSSRLFLTLWAREKTQPVWSIVFVLKDMSSMQVVIDAKTGDVLEVKSLRF